MSSIKLQTRKTNSLIRDFFNNSLYKRNIIFSKKEEGVWSQLCSSMDIIDDTSSAFETFLEASADVFAHNPYLYTYGLLQACVIQQDAIRFLKRSLLGPSWDIDFSNKKYKYLNEIRFIRNEVVGHPSRTEHKGHASKYECHEVTYCSIDRNSLNSKGFRYQLCTYSKSEWKRVNFADLLQLQDECLDKELVAVLKEIRKEEKAHKISFKNKKLQGLSSLPSMYDISNIYGALYNDLGWPAFDAYYAQYIKIKTGLNERLGYFQNSLNFVATRELTEKLDYIFSKLEFLKNRTDIERREFEIYVYALEQCWNELKSHLSQVDQAFEI